MCNLKQRKNQQISNFPEELLSSLPSKDLSGPRSPPEIDTPITNFASLLSKRIPNEKDLELPAAKFRKITSATSKPIKSTTFFTDVDVTSILGRTEKKRM